MTLGNWNGCGCLAEVRKETESGLPPTKRLFDALVSLEENPASSNPIFINF